MEGSPEDPKPKASEEDVIAAQKGETLEQRLARKDKEAEEKLRRAKERHPERFDQKVKENPFGVEDVEDWHDRNDDRKVYRGGED